MNFEYSEVNRDENQIKDESFGRGLRQRRTDKYHSCDGLHDHHGKRQEIVPRRGEPEGKASRLVSWFSIICGIIIINYWRACPLLILRRI